MRSLQDAVSTAAQFTVVKPPEGTALNAVVLEPGRVRASTQVMGVTVAADIEVECAVDAAKFLAMVRACGGAPKLKLTGDTLVVSGAGATYKLKTIPDDRWPLTPEPPEKGWKTITANVADAVTAMGGLVDPRSSSAAFVYLRLHPLWVCAARQDSMVVLHTGLVKEPFSVDPGVFKGVGTDVKIAVNGGKLFLREKAAGVTRWALGAAVEWPDGSVIQLLDATRNKPGRSARINPSDLRQLARQAAAITDDKAEAFKFELDKVIRLSGAAEASSFVGASEVRDVKGGQVSAVGIRPDRLDTLCDIMGSFAPTALLTVIGDVDPVLVQATTDDESLHLEGLMMPSRLR